MIISQKDKTIEHCRIELEGRKSDIRIFQETPLKIHRKIKVKGDSGYVGIQKVRARSQIPHKKPKNGELTIKKKGQNTAFRSNRVKIAHVNRLCKCFLIIQETCRNRLNHIAQIWLIVCGLVNINIEKVYAYLRRRSNNRTM